MEPYRYLIWLALTCFPLLIIWMRFFNIFKPYIRVGIYLNLIFFIPGALWDFFAMEKGVWYFNGPFITPLIARHFPLEEFLLIFLFPWFIMTVTVFFREFFFKSATQ